MTAAERIALRELSVALRRLAARRSIGQEDERDLRLIADTLDDLALGGSEPPTGKRIR